MDNTSINSELNSDGFISVVGIRVVIVNACTNINPLY